MKQLFAGITTLFRTTNAFRTQVNNRFYLYEAPEHVQFPYCVYFLVGNTNDYTFSTTFDNVLLQFSLFSNTKGVGEVSDMFDNLTTLFDDSVLSVSDYSFVRMTREGANLLYETDPKKIWHYAVTYNVLLES